MTSLRITSGTHRGRRVVVPKGDLRPTSERARQAFFDIVGDRIHKAQFLDLFAGSGIFCFEAVSRGARAAIAVDSSRVQTSAIERNAGELGLPVRTITSDALAGIKRLRGEVLDVVYADPPYRYERYDHLLMSIDAELTLAPDAILAIEHRRRTNPFDATASPLLEARLTRLQPWRRAEYGEVWISLFTA